MYRVGVVLLVVISWQATCIAAVPELPIRYIVENADSLLNKRVAVKGIVVDSIVRRDPYNPRIRGKYVIQDQNGDTIEVWTSQALPPKNQFKKVVGIVSRAGNMVYLFEAPLADWRLWGALVVLGAVAVVLLVLLLRKDGGKNNGSESGTKIVCSKCGHENAASANYCEKCGSRLGEEPGTSERDREQRDHREPDLTVVVGEEEVIADLVVLEGPGAAPQQQFRLVKGQRFLIGRSPEAHIRLRDEAVSKQHARIVWENDGFHIYDLGSTNGTFVNGERVTEKRLEDHDEIKVGQTVLIYRLIKSPQDG